MNKTYISVSISDFTSLPVYIRQTCMLTRTMFWVFLEQGTILQISEKINIFIVQLLEQSFQSPQNDAKSVHTASIDTAWFSHAILFRED